MAIIDFTIHVSNASEVSALFDRIEVWRAASELGTYVEVTSTEPAAAVLNGTVTGPWNLNTRTLTVRLNGADPVTVTFTGSDPLPLLTVLAQINAVLPNFASETVPDSGKIKIQSSITGTQSSIELSGTAPAVLGLVTTHTNGTSARPLISANTEDYDFRDYDGEITFWYKTRYISTVTGTLSTFSPSFKGGEGSALSSSAVVLGSIAIADSQGNPIVGRRIIFVTTGPQVVSDGSGNNYGILPSVNRITVVTDSNGRASLSLVKNQSLKVFIEGTTFQREFVVPTTDFDILTTASAQPDPLSIVTTPPLPIRVS